MNFVFYLSITSGFWILFLLFRRISDELLLSRVQITKIVTLFSVISLLLTCFNKKFGYFNIIFIYFFLFSMFFLKFLIKKIREKQFQQLISVFLSRLILKMKAGLSFRQSFLEELNNQDVFMAEKFKIIYNIVTFSQQNWNKNHKKWVVEFVEVLKSVDQQPHLSIKRLEIYNQKLKKQKFFRQRSENAMRSLKIQSLFLCFFYILLLIFTLFNYSWAEYKQLYLISLVLFIIGFCLTLKVGSSYKWNL